MQSSSPPSVWDSVVCGVDLSPASVHAALESARLMPPAARLTLCSVVSPEAIADEPSLERTLTHDAEAALERAQAEIQPFHDAELHLREGPPIARLLDEVRAEHATLVAVGSHGHSHAAGLALGRVATAMLHEASCSVLIVDASPPSDGEVVVGFDGSGGARRALAAGRELSERLMLKLRAIVATGDAHPLEPGWLDDELAPELALIEDPRTAVDALEDASRSARLLVVGSRHLQGVMALSSVSERAARRAGCPVLVVR